VAALFAIMTKVGIVAILRVQAIALEPVMPDLLDNWLTTLALATVAFAALGALAAARLQALIAWLVLLSAGTLLVTPAQASTEVSAAALYYLLQSTLAGAAFFLLAGLIAEQRGKAADQFMAGPPLPATWLKIAFLLAATTAASLPPFSGFVGKLMLLTSTREVAAGPAIWVVVLISGFIVMAALARDGCALIWKHKAAGTPMPGQPVGWQRATATVLLIAAGPLLAIGARPLSDYATRTAAQLHAPGAYVTGVLGAGAMSTGDEARP